MDLELQDLILAWIGFFSGLAGIVFGVALGVPIVVIIALVLVAAAITMLIDTFVRYHWNNIPEYVLYYKERFMWTP